MVITELHFPVILQTFSYTHFRGPHEKNRRKKILLCLFRSLMFVHPTQLWKWKNNSSKNSFRKIMKIINFSVTQLTTVANWMVYFYYIGFSCYKLKLFIFNASENETLLPSRSTTQPCNPRPTSTLHIFNSLWLGDESLPSPFALLLLCWFFYLTSWNEIEWENTNRTNRNEIQGRQKFVDSKHFPVTLQIWF